MVRVVPSPIRLSADIVPWCSRTMARDTLSPRPVPFPVSFVVKNGSKIISSLSRGIPVPVSVIRARMRSPSFSVTITSFRARLPACSIAKWALLITFRSTCCIWWKSSIVGGRFGSIRRSTSMSSTRSW